MSNNIEIEVKDGLAEGDVVILNPRAIVAEARDDDEGAPAVDVKQRFGDAPPPGAAEAGRAGSRRRRREAAGAAGAVRAGRGWTSCNSTRTATRKSAATKPPSGCSSFFDKIDTNSDGFIDAKEAAAAAAAAGKWKPVAVARAVPAASRPRRCIRLAAPVRIPPLYPPPR